jgi:hypothetical protein
MPLAAADIDAIGALLTNQLAPIHAKIDGLGEALRTELMSVIEERFRVLSTTLPVQQPAVSVDAVTASLDRVAARLDALERNAGSSTFFASGNVTPSGADSVASKRQRGWEPVHNVFSAGAASSSGYGHNSPAPPVVVANGAQDLRKVWFMGFPEELLSTALRKFTKAAIDERCGDGFADLCEIQCGNTKRFCSARFPTDAMARSFIERCGDQPLVYKNKNGVSTVVRAKGDKSQDQRKMGQFTGHLWSASFNLISAAGKWVGKTRLGTQGAKGCLWVVNEDSEDTIFKLFNYGSNTDGNCFASHNSGACQHWGISDEQALAIIAGAMAQSL